MKERTTKQSRAKQRKAKHSKSVLEGGKRRKEGRGRRQEEGEGRNGVTSYKVAKLQSYKVASYKVEGRERRETKDLGASQRSERDV